MSASAVEDALRAASESRSGALIAYLPIGFPDLETSIDAAVAVVEAGADVLELGLPYSDPVMDGPVIQAATQKALEAGFRVRDVFTAIGAIRERLAARGLSAPLLVMTYWNPVMQYGVQRFADALKAAGGAGLITPDITPDSAADWLAASELAGLDRVFLAAPTSSDERLRLAVEHSRGFVYTVSTMGITGARSDVDAAARGLAARLRAAGATGSERSAAAGATIPIAVGIGISTPEQVRDVLGYADGAIVGSALVTALAEGGIERLAALAGALAGATKSS